MHKRVPISGTTSIDTERVAAKYRARILDLPARRVLVTYLTESEQSKDLTLPPNCGGLGRVRHFRRETSTGWPANPLPIDPACHALGLAPANLIRAQAFQNAACAWRCWYCFVPYALLAGDERRARWVTCDELLDLYFAESDRPVVIDLTGGSPDLTPEWVIWMMDALIARGNADDVYLWSDDNLSTDFLWTEVQPDQLDLLRSYTHYGRVACFKGFDETSFSHNTRAEPRSFELQFERFLRMRDLGIDLYAYVTLTTPDRGSIEYGVPAFLDRLQNIDEHLPLRTVPLQIVAYTPVIGRLDPVRIAALAHQEAAIAVWQREIERRFESPLREHRIYDVPFGRRV